MTKLAVVGGSGLYDLPALSDVRRVMADTPYGPPSDELVMARIEGCDTELVFLPRHGRGHRIPPHAVNYRANICALKQVGVDAVVAVSATGSMKEHIEPGHLVVIDQLIDLTKRRASTFFDDGSVAHVAFAEPICPVLAASLHAAAVAVAAAEPAAGRTTVHRGGTYLCIEGPQFSTRAESLLYRSWGVDLIGMTNMPEAKLAREAELPYATLALATDYDCWHETEQAVDVKAIVARLGAMVGLAQRTVLRLARNLPDLSLSPARHALCDAVMTARADMSPLARQRLAWLLGGDSP